MKLLYISALLCVIVLINDKFGSDYLEFKNIEQVLIKITTISQFNYCDFIYILQKYWQCVAVIIVSIIIYWYGEFIKLSFYITIFLVTERAIKFDKIFNDYAKGE